MCRYALKKYKPHYVCFDCRKTFKQTIIEDIIVRNGDWDFYWLLNYSRNKPKVEKFKKNHPEILERFEKEYENKIYKCPDCAKEMHSIGMDFKAPKKDKIKEWEIVKSMYKLGNTFHTCGCSGPGYIPHNPKDYLIYLENRKVEYETNLHERSEDLSTEEKNKYISYWKTKLDLLNSEIQIQNIR
ncbi:hypothetical protein [Aureivirga sp. CE67]|uniref:hypothetical protein n=1 Tax=Aureivirga sp. CE67 TaxID=1788983 RepID=UPI0018C9A0D6|nr:hypothetical protein [Aureivirga sp. CE67]